MIWMSSVLRFSHDGAAYYVILVFIRDSSDFIIQSIHNNPSFPFSNSFPTKKMPLFPFKSNNHFVASSDGIVLQVYELTKSSIHLSSIQKADWKKLATIDTYIEDDDMGSKVPNVMPYNGLLFFDGHGTIEGREALAMLAQHLRQLHLLVSPEGYCFQEVSEFGVYSDFGIHYMRLNDLFSWPRHKVDLATTNVWSRLELKYNLPKHKNTSQLLTVGGGVSKEKYAELEMLVKEKLKEEMDEVNEAKEEELKKLKKANQDHQKQVQKKDKELQMLKKKKEDEEEANTKRIEELEKLNEDLDEANKAKDEELHKLAKSKNVGEMQKQLKKKDDELRMLKKKKDEEEETKAQRIGELEKLNEDLEEAIRAEAEKVEELSKLKKSDNELRKLLKMKDNELRVLEKKKEDVEEAKTSRYEEVEKLKKELETANQAKDYELRKLKEEKDEEVLKIQREREVELRNMANNKKDNEDEKSRRNEELKKVNKEMEVKNREKDKELDKLRKEKNEEMQKLLKEKSQELEVLEREKNDEAAKTRKVEGELREAREELSSSLAQMKEKLEECQKKSWTILPSTKFLPESLDAKEKYLSRRQRVPPDTFILRKQLSSRYFVSDAHRLMDGMLVMSRLEVKFVDEESSTTMAWPRVPTLYVYVGKGTTEDFDVNDWWYLKTTHPEGGLTMLVYYEGKHSQISHDSGSDEPIIPLPYSKDAEVNSFPS